MFPALSNLPNHMAIWTVCGAVYGYVFNANPKLAACAFAMRPLADTLLFAVANPLFAGDLGKRSYQVYQITHACIAVLTIVAFRQLQLIAIKGTIVLASIETCLYMGRLVVQQALEEKEI